MASVNHITACASTHAPTTPSRSRRVMLRAHDIRRTYGLSMADALRRAWFIDNSLHRSEGARPLQVALVRAFSGARPASEPAASPTPSLGSCPQHPDATLIALGAELMRAWDCEITTIADAQRVYSDRAESLIEVAEIRTAAIVERIEHTAAQTLDGLTVKALAISWCHGGEALEHDSFGDQATTNMRLAASITKDLLAIGGRAQ